MPKLLCSECFKNEGLRLNAWRCGSDSEEMCNNCQSNKGRNLDKDQANSLVMDFFVRGTVVRAKYGAAPMLAFNEHHAGFIETSTPKDLIDDVKLISNYLSIGIFNYGPNLWMLGENYPLESLQSDSERSVVVARIVAEYPSLTINSQSIFYRIRINPRSIEKTEFDPPPDDILGKGRFDAPKFPVLYVSQDLEGCMHECRATMEDDIFVVSLIPNGDLRILDLSVVYREDKSDFESLDMAVHMLFMAKSHSYPIIREIGRRARDMGYDGVQYPSYFTHIRTGARPFETVFGMSIRRFPQYKSYIENDTIKNIVIFGRPLRDNILSIKSINRVILRRAIYDISFGPVGYDN